MKRPRPGNVKFNRHQAPPSPGSDNRIITAGNDRRGTPARVLAAVLIGISFAAIFGSEPTLHWTETLPDSRLNAALHDAAARWNEALSPLGVTRPYDLAARHAPRFRDTAF